MCTLALRILFLSRMKLAVRNEKSHTHTHTASMKLLDNSHDEVVSPPSNIIFILVNRNFLFFLSLFPNLNKQDTRITVPLSSEVCNRADTSMLCQLQYF